VKKFRLYTGEDVDKQYFEEALSELKREKWTRKNISELSPDHVNCILSFETISGKTMEYFYESDKGNIITVRSYEEYIKQV
jgi:hypothetical protein